jgi:hypothetical protein
MLNVRNIRMYESYEVGLYVFEFDANFKYQRNQSRAQK